MLSLNEFSFHRSGRGILAYILLPPAGGSCASLNDMIPALSDHASVLVLENPNYIRPGSTFLSVEQLAAQFVVAIDSQILDCKPYVFIGASFGGVVAFGMVRSMLSRSKPPGIQLVLLDSPSPQVEDGGEMVQEKSNTKTPSVDAVVSDVQAENGKALAKYEANTCMQGVAERNRAYSLESASVDESRVRSDLDQCYSLT